MLRQKKADAGGQIHEKVRLQLDHFLLKSSQFFFQHELAKLDKMCVRGPRRILKTKRARSNFSSSLFVMRFCFLISSLALFRVALVISDENLFSDGLYEPFDGNYVVAGYHELNTKTYILPGYPRTFYSLVTSLVIRALVICSLMSSSKLPNEV